KAPDVYFMPDNIAVELLDNVDNKFGPYGSKAVGEPPLMYGIGAYFALRHAMQAFRADREFSFDSPLTPEKLLLELHSDIAESDQHSAINTIEEKVQGSTAAS
ncbi:hypothetical protein MJD09_14635, partial [bacterium]|nr:hypothetical protein [bacterium]